MKNLKSSITLGMLTIFVNVCVAIMFVMEGKWPLTIVFSFVALIWMAAVCFQFKSLKLQQQLKAIAGSKHK